MTRLPDKTISKNHYSWHPDLENETENPGVLEIQTMQRMLFTQLLSLVSKAENKIQDYSMP